MLTDHRTYPHAWGTVVILMAALLMGGAFTARGAALHAIIVGDTNDPNIGVGVEADMKHILEFINHIGRNTPWNQQGTLKVFVTRSVFGGNPREERLSHRNLRAALANVPAGEDDVILFYYSGHGMGDDAGQTIWPSLYFEDNAFAYEQLLAPLQAKNPRLLIIITDACNNFSDWMPEMQFSAAKRMAKAAPIEQNYRELFLNQRGYILATSSIPGEISLAASTRPGSLFTNDLLMRIYQQLQSPSPPSWNRIETTELTYVDQGEKFKQHPQYEIRTNATQPEPIATPIPEPAFTPSPTPTPPPNEPQPNPEINCMTADAEAGEYFVYSVPSAGSCGGVIGTPGIGGDKALVEVEFIKGIRPKNFQCVPTRARLSVVPENDNWYYTCTLEPAGAEQVWARWQW